jgi:hypothetical protein
MVSFKYRALHLGEKAPGAQWTGGWEDPRADLHPEAKRKISVTASAGNRTPAVQPVAQCPR